MKYQVFRNYTVENLFSNLEVLYSGYGDISFIDDNVDRYIWSYFAPININQEVIQNELESYKGMLEVVLERIPNEKHIFLLSSQLFFDCNILLNKLSLKSIVDNYNKYLFDIAAKNNNVIYIDTQLFFEKVKEEIIDWRYYLISKMIVNPKIAKDFQSWFFSIIDVYEGKRKKCLVLDLDNTLWGGILGEDGVAGIKIGGDYPGNVFEMFQKYLLDLSRKGVMLAICSKNNETDVIEAWNNNPFMVLKQDNFVAWEINWNNKAENLIKLSEKLNIGLDSFVFVDDNPTERELIRQVLPVVEVPEFPDQPYNIPSLIKKISSYFYTFKITEEDRLKTQQYKENFLRETLKSSYGSFEEYLRNLEIQLEIEQLNDYSLPRIAQLTQKTNQFNLTTKRLTEQDLIILQKNGAKVYTLTVIDKFGSYGIVGVAIVKISINNAEIDNILLSCRVLGKEIEFAFVTEILEQLKLENIINVKASYIKTSKNSQVIDFFDKLGFTLINKKEDMKSYSLNLTLFKYSKSDKHIIIK